MVLEWISGGKKNKHPMADPRQARRIVAGLPADDAAGALKEITRLLESLAQSEEFKLNRRFENLDLLDIASKGHEHKLLQQYLATPRHKKSDEQRLWTDVYGFWRRLAEGYLQCLQQYEAIPGSTTLFKSILPVIIVRALRALGQQIKWIFLRYGLVEARIWGDLSRLYQFVETQGFVDEEIAAYPGPDGTSTARREMLSALMLAASSTDSLHPVEQVHSATLVAHFSRLFVLGTKPEEGCTHWFDLAVPEAPSRLIGGGATSSATARFFGAGPGLHELEQLKAHIAYTDSLPQGLELYGDPGNDAVMSLLTHLERNWAGKTQARRFERRKVATRVTVVPGLDEIVRVLEFADNDSLDFTHLQSAESWIVEDLSEGGCGSVIPTMAGDWVGVGGLVGVEGGAFRDWSVGVIRRVTQNKERQQRVGVELLCKASALARLHNNSSKGPSAAAVSRAPAPIVLLAPTLEGRKEVSAILGKGLADRYEHMEVAVTGDNYLLIFRKMMERGESYDLARFEVRHQ